jgi:hypothetical protein
MTLFTRDMTAYIEESGIKKVDIPAADSVRAISCPLYLGATLSGQFLTRQRMCDSQRTRFGNDNSEVPVMGGSLEVCFHGL